MTAISQDRFRQIVGEILHFIEKEQIRETTDLEKRLNKSFQSTEGSILIELRPSNLRTSAYTISYTIKKTGIPLEIRINPALGYTAIMIKLQDLIQGYAPFTTDPYNNVIQHKHIPYLDIEKIKEELNNLRN